MRKYNKYQKGINSQNALRELQEKERLENLYYQDDDLSDLAEIRAKE